MIQINNNIMENTFQEALCIESHPHKEIKAGNSYFIRPINACKCDCVEVYGVINMVFYDNVLQKVNINNPIRCNNCNTLYNVKNTNAIVASRRFALIATDKEVEQSVKQSELVST